MSEDAKPRASARRGSIADGAQDSLNQRESLKAHMRELLQKEPPGTARHESIRKWLERSEEQESHVSQSITQELEAEYTASMSFHPRPRAGLRHSAPNVMAERPAESAMLTHMRGELLKESIDSNRRAALVKWIERAEAQQAELEHSIEIESAESEMSFNQQHIRPSSAPAGGRRTTYYDGSGENIAAKSSSKGSALLAALFKLKFGRRKQKKEAASTRHEQPNNDDQPSQPTLTPARSSEEKRRQALAVQPARPIKAADA